MPPAPGIRPKTDLRLAEDGRFSCGKAHVTPEHELVAGAAHATFYLRDRNQAACAHVAKEETEGRFPGELHGRLAVSFDLRDVDVRNEIVRVCALEYEHLGCVVGLRLLKDGNQVADELRAQEIHGRGSDLGEQNGAVALHADRFQSLGHRWFSS